MNLFGIANDAKAIPMITYPVPDDSTLFVQIIHVYNHYVCVSGQFIRDPTLCFTDFQIYDSLNGVANNEYIVSRLSGIFKHSPCQYFQIENVKVTRQTNSHDCGVHAIANAFWCCNGLDPSDFNLNTTELRDHLLKIIIDKKFTEFPASFSSFEKTILHKEVYDVVCCTCRETIEDEDMLQCIECFEFFHKRCLNQDYLRKSGINHWKCQYRCDNLFPRTILYVD